jgi:hypothetical protein
MFNPYNPNPNPASNAALAAMKGAAFASSRQRWEKAYIHEVYPDTYCCDVFTEKGKFLAGVPWPNNSGEILVPKRGDKYTVMYELGTPMLLPITPDAQPGSQKNQAKSRAPIAVTPVAAVGGNDTAYTGRGDNDLRGDKPKDVVSGDWLKMGDLGNVLGVLEGGSVVMKAADLAQIIATQAKNMLRLIGQNLSIYTGAGSLDFKTSDGKTSIILRAGADCDVESNPDQENFRIRCELGDDGELVDFRVTDGSGRNLYRIHVDPDGRVDTEMAQRTSAVEGDSWDATGGSRYESTEQDKTDVVGGSRTVITGKNVDHDTSGSHRVRSSNDIGLAAAHDLLLSSFRNTLVTATGDVTSADPALLFTVGNGDVAFKIGEPGVDAQVRHSGFTVDTLTGDIAISSVLGKIELNSTVAGNVKLGGVSGVGPFSAVLFETLSIFMDIFGAMIDTHVHFHPGLGIIPTAPPFLPPYALSRGSLSAAKSTFVKIGG